MVMRVLHRNSLMPGDKEILVVPDRGMLPRNLSTSGRYVLELIIRGRAVIKVRKDVRQVVSAAK
jgi:hypothetical protein